MTIKHAGIALIIGVVFSFASGLLFPGNVLINPVDQLDYAQAIGAIADAPEVAHVMISLSIFGMLFTAFAFITGIYPLTNQSTGVANTLLRFGIMLSVFEWCILIIGDGMRHIAVHLTQRASATTDAAEATLLSGLSLDVWVSLVAVFMAFVPIFPIASFLVGIGLVARIPTTNLPKLASYGLVIVGIVGFIIYFLAMLAPGSDPNFYLTVYNILLFFGAICFAVLGYGMIKGQDGLTEEA